MENVAASGVGIVGVGRCLPGKKLSNAQIEAQCNLPPGTIEEKTGVRERYILSDEESSSTLAAAAAKQALEHAGVTPDQIGLIVCCAFTGDYVYPALACKVQEMLGAWNAGAFDLMANCTGFQVGLTVASDRMYVDRNISHVLVIGVTAQSRFINWFDGDSAMYFGDGAGAAVLGRVPEGYGILANDIMSNGRVYEAVRLRGGGSSHPMRQENVDLGLQYFEVNGMEVWKQVIQNQPKVMRRVLEKIGKGIEDVDFYIFHQANLKLIEFLMAKMKQPMAKTFTNVATIGNTSDASMAIALCDAVMAGAIKRDQLLMISGVGAGFTFGATAVRWY